MVRGYYVSRKGDKKALGGYEVSSFMWMDGFSTIAKHPWLVMDEEYNEKVFRIHTSSSILHHHPSHVVCAHGWVGWLVHLFTLAFYWLPKCPSPCNFLTKILFPSSSSSSSFSQAFVLHLLCVCVCE
jgi:hypothetical protein